MLRTALMMAASAALLAETACGDAATAAAADAPMGGAPMSASLASAAAPAAATGGTQTIEIIDRFGVGQPMAAGRITLPAGWRAEGGVNWDNSTSCVTNQMKFQWRAVAPDGVTAVELLPSYSWQSPAAYTRMNPCPVERITSPRDFLPMVARAMRPGARVIDYRDRADLTAQAQRSDSPGWHSQVGDLKIAYVSGGVPVEEILSATVSQNNMGGNAGGFVLAYRAAAGKLDTAFLERTRASMKGSAQYGQAILRRGTGNVDRYAGEQSAAISSWHNQRMGEINAKGASDRAAIRARGNAETNAIYAQTAADTAATNDGINASNLRALKEEQTWSNPSTGQTVQGSIHGGQRVFEMPDGNFARTDDPYYSPPGSTEYDPQ